MTILLIIPLSNKISVYGVKKEKKMGVLFYLYILIVKSFINNYSLTNKLSSSFFYHYPSLVIKWFKICSSHKSTIDKQLVGLYLIWNICWVNRAHSKKRMLRLWNLWNNKLMLTIKKFMIAASPEIPKTPTLKT